MKAKSKFLFLKIFEDCKIISEIILLIPILSVLIFLVFYFNNIFIFDFDTSKNVFPISLLK